MITCKEDLIGTYIKNDNGELLKLYIEKCLSLGFRLSPAFSGGRVLDETLTHVAVGIDRDCVWAVRGNYNAMEKQLTLEDLKPQTKEVEWVNGLPPVGVECEAVFIEHEHKGYGEFLILGYHSNYVWMEYIGELGNKSKHYTANIDMVKFRKPETEAERKEREELEAAYDLLCVGNRALSVTAPCTFDEFKLDDPQCYFWLSIVRKTNYKVKGE